MLCLSSNEFLSFNPSACSPGPECSPGEGPPAECAAGSPECGGAPSGGIGVAKKNKSDAYDGGILRRKLLFEMDMTPVDPPSDESDDLGKPCVKTGILVAGVHRNSQGGLSGASS
jgi:hypothetical protein